MWLDERNEFADNVSVANAAGTDVIGDVIDTGGDGREGSSEDLFLVIQSGDTEIITGGAAGTIRFELVSDSVEALSSPTVHYVSADFVTDDTSNNDPEMGPNALILAVQLPRGTYQRYLGIQTVITTTTVTAGTINAFLSPTPPDWVAMPDALPTVA